MSNNSNKRAPTTATQRLKQDYLRIKKDPVPYICAEPLPSNILEWHYVVRGPETTPYEGKGMKQKWLALWLACLSNCMAV
uniref:UBC core domain-containing protein n=1 Tax=Phasianus colchicus TaxID=9054 RepID=A0A669R168_PHACC